LQELSRTITGRNNADTGIYAGSYSLVNQNTTYDNGTNMRTSAGCKIGLNVML
jgi:hypothetical protein